MTDPQQPPALWLACQRCQREMVALNRNDNVTGHASWTCLMCRHVFTTGDAAIVKENAIRHQQDTDH